MRLLLAAQALAIAFVLASGSFLPPLVASHFSAGGAANAFMPRATYLGFTCVLLVGLPLLIALITSLSSVLPARFINLPDRDYWLAPERQGETLAYIRKHGAHFGLMLTAFLCFVHWLVVLANARSPALFPEYLFFVGMAAFLVGLVIWLGGFIAHFRRRP
jgi:uncharacterized membrane protein